MEKLLEILLVVDNIMLEQLVVMQLYTVLMLDLLVVVLVDLNVMLIAV
jgi:hypothetical protein